MRKIKFRAWNEKEGLCYPRKLRELNIILTFDGDVLFDNYAVETSRWYVMQYTGLKDKNGKEIYEGDVVDYEWIKNYRNQVVMWHEECARWSLIDQNDNAPYGVCVTHISKRATVIGNIYENPELIGN